MTVIRDTVKNDAGQNVDILIEVDEKALNEGDDRLGENMGQPDHAQFTYAQSFPPEGTPLHPHAYVFLYYFSIEGGLKNTSLDNCN